MKKKHAHCTPICAMPSSAAAQGNFPISLQHPMSLVLSGSVKMFAMLAVPETVPRSTNMGLRPREERRAIILWCCGRYDARMPTTRPLFTVSYGLGLDERHLTLK